MPTDGAHATPTEAGGTSPLDPMAILMSGVMPQTSSGLDPRQHDRNRATASSRRQHRALTRVTVRRSLAQDSKALYALVLDIESYPLFVPGCARVRVLSRREIAPGRMEIVSRMTVGVLPLQMTYANCTSADRDGKLIRVTSADGPLRHLHVLWRFEPLGPERTLIILDVTYEFRNPIVAALAASAFERLFAQLVDAFGRRALGR
jgi:coenzyme Q-binding protein COQ10